MISEISLQIELTVVSAILEKFHLSLVKDTVTVQRNAIPNV